MMTIPSGGIENSGLAHHQFIACGSSGADLPTFGAWEREVLEECYDHVHYVSLHTYYNNFKNDVPTFLASSALMADQIRKVVATCDAVQARRKSKRRIDLCFDEWNVWYTLGIRTLGKNLGRSPHPCWRMSMMPQTPWWLAAC